MVVLVVCLMFDADTQAFLLDKFLTLNFVAQLAYNTMYVHIYMYKSRYQSIYVTTVCMFVYITSM